MNFIKSIWNKVKSFFGNLFGSNKVAQVETKVELKAAAVAETEVAPAEVVDAAAVQAAEAAEHALMNELAEIFNRIVEIARLRNYVLEETRVAYLAKDKATMLRIEREMKARKYKAPKKVKAAKQAVAA